MLLAQRNREAEARAAASAARQRERERTEAERIVEAVTAACAPLAGLDRGALYRASNGSQEAVSLPDVAVRVLALAQAHLESLRAPETRPQPSAMVGL